MLKIGLIGCGGMGSTHAQCYSELKELAQIVAVADLVDSKAKSTAEKFGARIYKTGEELIKSEKLDIVDICLPTYLHTDHAVMAMEKGMNVFVEKPVCLTAEEAELLMETQSKTEKKVQVGQCVRYNHAYLWLKNAVSNGIYGKVISATFRRLSFNPIWGWDNWFNDISRSGGAALDLHIHDVDYVRYLMGGDPDDISAYATYNTDGSVNDIFATYRYGGALVNLESSWEYPRSHPFEASFRVKLEKATVVRYNDILTVYPVDGEAYQPNFEIEFDSSIDNGTNISGIANYYDELKDFIISVSEDKPVMIAPLSEAVKSLKLALRELKLADTNKMQEI